MLVCAGYGRGKGDKKLGVGPAPVGWPAQADWPNFKGSTRSGLKITEVTRIIISMFQAAGFSTETHVKPLIWRKALVLRKPLRSMWLMWCILVIGTN